MAKPVAQFYTPKAASELVGLTEERIVKLCEQIGAPIAICRVPNRENEGAGIGCYLVPAEVLKRFSDMMESIDGEMLARLSGEDGGAGRGA